MFFPHTRNAMGSFFVVVVVVLLLCGTVEQSVAFSMPTKPTTTTRSILFRHPSTTMTSSIQVPDDAKIKLSGVCGNTRPTTRSSFWKTTTTTTTTLSSAVVAFGDGTLLTKVWKTTSPLLQMIGEELHNLTPIQRIILVVTFVAGCQVGKTRPFWKRMTNVMDIPSNYFGPKAPILRGRAVSVTDGDTIRFLHVPTFFHPTSIRTSQKEKVSSVAMPIRLCTYDTPETAKFGKPGQPFGEEAKSHLQELLSPPTTTKSGRGRVIKVRLLQKDQYGRAVAQVFTGRWPFRRYIDEQMLQVGLAEVYQGMGAVYGPKGKEEYLRMEKQARDHKRGIWSQTERESAAAYKKRTKK